MQILHDGPQGIVQVGMVFPLCRMPTQAHSKHMLCSLFPSYPALAPRVHWGEGLAAGQAELAECYQQLCPPHPQVGRKTLLPVCDICLCPSDSDCTLLPAGLVTQDWKEPVLGGAAGVVLAGREGWQLPNLSPVAWTESFPLRGTGAQQ